MSEARGPVFPCEALPGICLSKAIIPSSRSPASISCQDQPAPFGCYQYPFFALDPVWTDEFMATAVGIYESGVMPPKELELLSIAFDASYTHMYAPGTRRHIIKAGATMEEIMEVLKLCVVQGAQHAISACRSSPRSWSAPRASLRSEGHRRENPGRRRLKSWSGFAPDFCAANERAKPERGFSLVVGRADYGAVVRRSRVS